MTTHFTEEAEYLCDRVAIVRKGKIVALDNLSNLVKSINIHDKITFECSDKIDTQVILSWKSVKNCEILENNYCI